MLNQHRHAGAGVTGLVTAIPHIDPPIDMLMPAGAGVVGDGVVAGVGGSDDYAVKGQTKLLAAPRQRSVS